MFAVIRTGGKQYKVQEGDVLNVELLGSKDDKSASFEVLLIGNGDKVTLGNPLVKGASVTADILGEVKEKKVTAFKYKRRQGYHRTVGHRQRKTQVKIKSIVG
jgi:large subunit ribosomal protein L21